MMTREKLQPELWLIMAILSWLVGTGLGYMLFY